MVALESLLLATLVRHVLVMAPEAVPSPSVDTASDTADVSRPEGADAPAAPNAPEAATAPTPDPAIGEASPAPASPPPTPAVAASQPAQPAVPTTSPAPPSEYRPFFEPEPASDSAFAEPGRRRLYPVLSVGKGAFCFVDGTHCKSGLLASASVAIGVRIPSSDVAPEQPYSHFTVDFGGIVRPLMLKRGTWHPWGLGLTGSWSRGSGAAMEVEEQPGGGDVDTTDENPFGSGGTEGSELLLARTPHTDAWRIAAINRVWLSQKRYAPHLDLSIGAVRSEVMTSGVALWGTHAQVGFGFTGWGSVYVSGDFLDRDARVVAGIRGHAIAAAPIIALALIGLAAGGAL